MKSKRQVISEQELEANLSRIHDWIKVADGKINVFLVFIGILIPYAISMAYDSFLQNLFNMSVNLIGSFLISSFFIVFGLLKLVISLSPKIRKSKYQKSLIFFGDIANYDHEDFKQLIGSMSKKDYRLDLIDQIYISSQIANKKFICFKDSLSLFSISLVCFLITYFVFRLESFYG